MRHIVVIDNYDSFVYNLVRYVEEMGCTVNVQRNDQLNFPEIDQADGIILSPGPGIPSEAGELLEIIKRYSSTKNILGVCLGHQAIAQSFDGELAPATLPVHGKSSSIQQMNQSALFETLPDTFEVGRYHSWLVQRLPAHFIGTAETEENEIMAMEHESLPIYGVQFHPESILTPHGRTIIQNWINTLL
jgi:anthranilate synthase component II